MSIRVDVHDYRESGYSNYRLTPCFLSGMYKTHHSIWQEMGFFPIGAPYAKRLLKINNVTLSSEAERVAEKAMLCRILEKKRFPQEIDESLGDGIREAANLECKVDTQRFLSMFTADSADQGFVRIRKLYDQE